MLSLPLAYSLTDRAAIIGLIIKLVLILQSVKVSVINGLSQRNNYGENTEKSVLRKHKSFKMIAKRCSSSLN